MYACRVWLICFSCFKCFGEDMTKAHLTKQIKQNKTKQLTKPICHWKLRLHNDCGPTFDGQLEKQQSTARGKVEKVPMGIQDEKSRKDMAGEGKLFSRTGA